jgi:hypothetical protein
VLVGRSLHDGVLNNIDVCGDGVGVCSEYSTLNMVVFKYYIGANAKPSETNHLMPVSETILSIGYLIPESKFSIVLIYFTFTYGSVG